MNTLPNYRENLATKREERYIEEQKKRKYRILLVNLPFVIGEDPRFPDERSVMKYIESIYEEEFSDRKTYSQIKVWLGARDHNW